MKRLVAAANLHFAKEFEQLETCLASQLDSRFPAIADLGTYMLDSGGKRFRPALSLLFFKLLESEENITAAIELGTVIELIHMATLAHDDVIDRAETRRNRESLWKSSSNTSAILVGDFIFSRAFRLLNNYPEKIRLIVIDAVETVLEGELLQESLRGRVPTETEYDMVNKGKTAALMSAACAVGAWASDENISEAKLQSIEHAGQSLGSAFQMIDDLFDVFGDEEIGKPRWSDQRGGWLTWPYMRLIEQSNAENDVLERLSNPELGHDERQAIITEMDGLGIRQELMNRAESEIVRMKECIDWIPDSELKQLLIESSDFVLQRTT